MTFLFGLQGGFLCTAMNYSLRQYPTVRQHLHSPYCDANQTLPTSAHALSSHFSHNCSVTPTSKLLTPHRRTPVFQASHHCRHTNFQLSNMSTIFRERPTRSILTAAMIPTTRQSTHHNDRYQYTHITTQSTYPPPSAAQLISTPHYTSTYGRSILPHVPISSHSRTRLIICTFGYPPRPLACH
jgi:hypothetical protein